MSKYAPTKNSEQVYIYNPDGWDPIKSLPSDLHEHADAARYIVHRIFMGRIIDRSHRNDLVPLKAQYMKGVLGDVYFTVKDALRNSHTIVTNNQFIVGRQCKRYGLGHMLRDIRHVRTEVTDKFIAKRIIAVRKEEVELPKPHVYAYLDEWLHQIDIDREGAESHIAFNNDFFEHHDGRHEASVRLIAEKEWFSKVCDQGRYHSNVSCLETSLRQFLSFNGQKLVNLDIRNSQPLIFGSLVLNSLANDGFLESVHSFQESAKVQSSNASKNNKSKSPKKSNLSQEFKSSLLSSFSSPNPSLYDSENYPLKKENREDGQSHLMNDANHYIQLCQEGEFYNHLMKQANYPQDESVRRQFKQSFFRETFFCENKHEGRAAILFRKEFPTVYDVLRQLKSRDYKTPSLCLQRAESDIIINRAVRRLRDEHRDVPIWTIHDSIMTTPNHADTVKEVMLEAFSTVGLIPTIKITPA